MVPKTNSLSYKNYVTMCSQNKTTLHQLRFRDMQQINGEYFWEDSESNIFVWTGLFYCGSPHSFTL